MSTEGQNPSAWARLTGWFSRALSLGGGVTVPTAAEPDKPIPAGAAFGVGLSTPPEYDPAGALRAVALSPWYHAAIASKAADLAMLPLRVESMTGEAIERHAILDLLANPNGKRGNLNGQSVAVRPVVWRELCEQWVVDLETGGNCYGHLLISGALPVGLLWLPPTRVRPIANSLGSIAGYAVDDGSGFGGGANLPCAAPRQSGIVSAHRFRARYDGTDIGGMAPTAPLDAVLTADMHATRRSAESSRKGRPDAIAAPPSGSPPLSPMQVAQAQESVNKAFTAQDQGVAVVSGAIEITPLAWSPKEMEEAERSAMSRAAVLAVTGVPPVRVGLETANYATAREQSSQYWRGLCGVASRLEGLLDMIGACYSPPVRVRLDFRGVGPLQEDRGARLERVSVHITNGMSPARAYALEGFTDVAAEDFEASDTEQADTGDTSSDDPDGGAVDVAAQDLLDAIETGDDALIADAVAALQSAIDDAG